MVVKAVKIRVFKQSLLRIIYHFYELYIIWVSILRVIVSSTHDIISETLLSNIGYTKGNAIILSKVSCLARCLDLIFDCSLENIGE